MSQPGEGAPSPKTAFDLLKEGTDLSKSILESDPNIEIRTQVSNLSRELGDRYRDNKDTAGMEAAVVGLRALVEGQLNALPAHNAEAPPPERASQVGPEPKDVFPPEVLAASEAINKKALEHAPTPEQAEAFRQETIKTMAGETSEAVEAEALTTAMNKIYESRTAIDPANAEQKILDALPEGPMKERLRSSGLRVTFRSSGGQEMLNGGELIFVQKADSPEREGWAFPVPSQMRAAAQVDFFAHDSGSPSYVAHPAKVKVRGNMMETLSKGALTETKPSEPQPQIAQVETDPTKVVPVSQLEKEPGTGRQHPPAPPPPEAATQVETKSKSGGGFLTQDEIDALLSGVAAAPPASPPAGLTPEPDVIDFDPSPFSMPASRAEAAPPARDDRWYDVQQKFDLAKAYEEMGDKDGAKDILGEVLMQGDEKQQTEARRLLAPLLRTESEPSHTEAAWPQADASAAYDHGQYLLDGDALYTDLQQLRGGTVSPDVGNKWSSIVGEVMRDPAFGFGADQQKVDEEVFRRRKALLEEQRVEVARAQAGEVSEYEPRVIGRYPRGPGVEEAIPVEQDLGSQQANRSLLKSLVEKVTRAAEAVSERYTKSKEYLDNRAKQLDAQAEASGGERIIRRMGEAYNKLNWREKLGIGLVLGGSALVTGGASIYLPYAFTALLGAQRAFGAASLYISQEKALLDAKVAESGQLISAKERASISAALSGVLFAAAIGKSIEWANESGLVEHTREWLGSMLDKRLPSLDATPPSQIEAPTPPAAPAAAPTPEPAPAPVPSAPEAAAAGAFEMPKVEVKATPGKGYEYMAKRLMEKPEIKSIRPTIFGLQSDITRLLYAQSEGNLNKVLHDIAAEKGWFDEATQESAQINLDQKISFDKYGILQISNAETIERPPEGAPVTPPYPPEPIPVRPPTPEVLQQFENARAPLEAAPSEIAPAEVAPEAAPAPDSPPSVEQPAAPEAPTESVGETPAPSAEAPAPAQEVVNQAGLRIPLNEAHIYAGGGDGPIIFGGTPEAQAKAIELAFTNPETKVVYAPSADGKYTIAWIRNPDGGIAPAGPVETGGFLGFGKRWLEAPTPDQLQKLIK